MLSVLGDYSVDFWLRMRDGNKYFWGSAVQLYGGYRADFCFWQIYKYGKERVLYVADLEKTYNKMNRFNYRLFFMICIWISVAESDKNDICHKTCIRINRMFYIKHSNFTLKGSKKGIYDDLWIVYSIYEWMNI